MVLLENEGPPGSGLIVYTDCDRIPTSPPPAVGKYAARDPHPLVYCVTLPLEFVTLGVTADVTARSGATAK